MICFFPKKWYTLCKSSKELQNAIHIEGVRIIKPSIKKEDLAGSSFL